MVSYTLWWNLKQEMHVCGMSLVRCSLLGDVA